MRSLEKINNAYGIILSIYGIQTISKIEFGFRESENIVSKTGKFNE